MLPFCHEEFEYLPDEESGSVHGHDGLRRYFERWSEAWDNFDIGPTEFLDAGDYVFVGAVMKGRGRGSGVEVRKEGWQVWLIRGGRAARCEGVLGPCPGARSRRPVGAGRTRRVPLTFTRPVR